MGCPSGAGGAGPSLPTYPIPLTSFMKRLSCSFTEQFMGIPVTCRRHRINVFLRPLEEPPGSEDGAHPPPDTSQVPPAGLWRNWGEDERLIWGLCPAMHTWAHTR